MTGATRLHWTAACAILGKGYVERLRIRKGLSGIGSKQMIKGVRIANVPTLKEVLAGRAAMMLSYKAACNMGMWNCHIEICGGRNDNPLGIIYIYFAR